MESRNEPDLEVVLELVDGTEPSVELGPNARVTVTIISADIVCSSPISYNEFYYTNHYFSKRHNWCTILFIIVVLYCNFTRVATVFNSARRIEFA